MIGRNALDELFHNSPLGMTICTKKGRYIDANSAFEAITGYAKAELLEKTYWDITHPDYMDLESEIMAEAEANDHYGPYEKEYFHAEGHLIATRVWGVILRFEGEAYWWNYIEDISSRKNAEQALIKSEIRLRRILEDSHIPMSLVGRDGRFDYINPRMIEVVGYDLNDLATMEDWYEKAYPDREYQARVRAEHQGPIRSGEVPPNQERVIRCKDGRVKHIVFQHSTLGDKLLITAHDITDRKLAQAELAKSEARFRKIVESSPIALGLFGRDDRVEFLNDRMVELFGYTIQDIPTVTDWYRKAYPDPRVRAEIIRRQERDQARNIPPTKRERAVRCRDGSVKQVIFDYADLGEHLLITAQDITALKQAQEELTRSEGRLRRMVELAPVAMAILTKDDRIEYFNERMVQLFGYRAEEAPTIDDWYRLAYRESLNQVRTERREEHLNRDGLPRNRERRVHCKDGTFKDALYRYSDLGDFYLVTAQDITELRRAEMSLTRQNRFFAALHETVVQILDRLDPAEVLESVIRRAGGLMSADHGWITTVTPGGGHLVIESGIGKYKQAIGAILEPGEGVSGKVWVEERIIAVDDYHDLPRPVRGDWMKGLQAMVGAPLLSGSKVIGVLGLSREIGQAGFDSEEVELLGRFGQLASIALVNARAYAQLSLSEERYRDLFDSISDLVFTQDLDGRLLSFNRALEEAYGYSREELLGRRISDFMLPEHHAALETDYLDVLKAGQPYQGTTVYLRQDGTRRYIETMATLARPEEGEPYISGSARDVTDRWMAEKELRKVTDQLLQSQKMEAVGTLAGGVAHDFNNILQAISGYIQLLLRQDLGHRVDGYLAEIDGAVSRAAELVKRLLTFSRKVESKLRPTDLNQVVVTGGRLLERTIPKMIEIEYRLEPDLRVINADSTQLEQVLMNLVGNARDALPEGGLIRIETANLELGSEAAQEALGLQPGPYVRLVVRDDGPGMDEATVRNIFDPFFTTKSVGQGTGLGLSTAYGIIQSHGGRIECLSTLGEGTSFVVDIPATEPLGFGHRQTKGGPESGLDGTETVLIVDDEEAIIEILKDLLEEHGYQAIAATSGEAALALYGADPELFGLVVLDLGMPGMGGLTCLAELLRINPRAKVLIASGYAGDKDANQALSAGARDFISKPYRLQDIMVKIRTILDRD